jgi:hypothetical protein
MFAGDYTLTVAADGLGARSVAVDGLAPGETRALAIELGGAPALALTGRVVHLDGAPVAGASVRLLAPAEADDSPASPVLAANAFTGDPARFRRELETRTSDEDGAFRFELPSPGTYALEARSGPVLSVASAACAVTVDAPAPEVELVVPRGGTLAGRILVPEGAAVSGLRAWAMLDGELGYDAQYETAAELGADGRFVLAQLVAGTHRVFLMLPEYAHGSVRANGRVSGAVELGTVEVLEGVTTEVELDARARFPGQLVLTVLVDGAPAAGFDVVLQHTDWPGGLAPRAATDANGSTPPIAAFPGRYRVRVVAVDQGWNERWPEPVLVTSAELTELTLHVATARATLACSGAGGQPLAGEWVTVLRAADAPRRWEQVSARQTDALGRVELVLPPGEYALQRGRYKPSAEPETVPRTWTATGPLVTGVELP